MEPLGLMPEWDFNKNEGNDNSYHSEFYTGVVLTHGDQIRETWED